MLNVTICELYSVKLGLNMHLQNPAALFYTTSKILNSFLTCIRRLKDSYFENMNRFGRIFLILGHPTPQVSRRGQPPGRRKMQGTDLADRS